MTFLNKKKSREIKMTLHMFTHSALSILKENVIQNKDKYQDSIDWVEEYLNEQTIGQNEWIITISTDIDLSHLKLHFKKENTTAEEDLKNIKIFYEALKELPIDLATDERFWSYLCHITFKDYVQSRWGVNDENLLEHYFFKAAKAEGDRVLLRNAISQLWWYGHVTYDKSRDNPYELTDYLFQVIDFARQFGERAYSRNPRLVKIILSILKDELKFSPNGNRDSYRKLFRDINQAGGIKVLDFLDYNDIRQIIKNSLGGEVVLL
jgi:hypothetical protein